MSSLGHWMPEDGFHLLRQQGQTKHSVRTRCLAGKKQHLDRRQVQDHFCGSCHRHHHPKSNTASDTDHRACKVQFSSLSSSSSSSSSSAFTYSYSDAQVRNWRSDRPEPLVRGACASLSSSPSSFCPELAFEQASKTVTAQTPADQALWRPISTSLSSPSSSSSSSQDSYCESEDDAWSNSLVASLQHDTRHHHSSQYNTHRGGARVHMGIGGRGAIGGGTGNSPDPSSGVHPGQQGRGGAASNGSQSASDDADQDMDGMADEDGRKMPSSYTFRRRNAVVEGSEDAPRAKDFYPDASTN
ncbi:hypothetical protein EMPS_02439 [Entomortierella parvispora]|uniref:Uncharacterized protein n=1 Tax=Entomortierella parvispora TaxID=205924 RepID=A0A9P3LTX8_9FUNG|nr:hypothetical protein EMPS_02439 [Entomortierella parvispora]